MAISVTYSEMQGSPTEGLTRMGIKSATRTLECAWNDRWTLMQELLIEDYENTAGTLMSCTGCTCAPFPAANTGSSTVATYAKAIVTANYQILTVTLDSGDDGEDKTESIEPTAEFLTVGKEGLTWGSATGRNVEADETPGLLFIGVDYIFTKTFQESLSSDILKHIGTVNAKEITPSSEGMEGWTFEPETLLFQPPTIQRTIDSGGVLTWTVRYRFTYKPNWDGENALGWNYYWNQKKTGGAGFDAIWTTDEDGDSVIYKQYPPADFSALL